jgi:cell division protein FtsQ
VVIDVEERVAKAIVAIGKLYYVDADGVIFKELAEGENVEFPLVTGLGPEELSAGDLKIRRRLQDAVRLGDLMVKSAHTLSEIHFETADRIVLYTVGYPVALHMGSGDWEAKVRRLERVLGLWKRAADLARHELSRSSGGAAESVEAISWNNGAVGSV